MWKLASALTLIALAVPAAAQDARDSVAIRGEGKPYQTCMSPQTIVNLSAQRTVNVTVTDRENAGVYGSSVTNKSFTLGPSESAPLGCLMTSGMGMAIINHTYTIANASFAD